MQRYRSKNRESAMKTKGMRDFKPLEVSVPPRNGGPSDSEPWRFAYTEVC